MKNCKIDRRTKLSVILIFIIIYFSFWGEYWKTIIITILLFTNENDTIAKIIIGKDTIEIQRIEALNENKEDLKKAETEISQYIGPKREEKIKDDLERIFIMGYNSGKGIEPYTIDNIKIKRDAHGNIDEIQYDEI